MEDGVRIGVADPRGAAAIHPAADPSQGRPGAPRTRRILAASFVGTAIEYFDFNLYGTAAALVFGMAFFPAGAPGAQQLEALSTFALAYLVRPVGAVAFGHFGDRVGRKATLVASLLLMGASTVLIGCLPTYASAGWWAPALLCLLRCAQGIGFSGEWGGAALLAVENAPAGRRAWYGVFPQLGATAGSLTVSLGFPALSFVLTPDAFQAWGWRLPFLASAILVGVGLYLRLRLAEMPAFRAAMAEAPPERVPLAALLRDHGRAVLVSTLIAVNTFTLTYVFILFPIDYGTQVLGYDRSSLLLFESIAFCFDLAAIAASGLVADRIGTRRVLLAGMAATVAVSLGAGPLLGAAAWPRLLVGLCLGFTVIGCVFGPLSAALAAQFPTRVRYTGVAFAYNLSGILGIAAAPFLTQRLVAAGGVGLVGVYAAVPALLGLLAALAMRDAGGRGVGERGALERAGAHAGTPIAPDPR